MEVSVAMVSHPVAHQLQVQFAEDIRHCRQITIQSLAERSFGERLLHMVSYAVSRFVWSLLADPHMD
jgi:hypothetical protein